jgi:Xaa-Pro aminopeptidase
MNALNPRLNSPVSTRELERRWKAVRQRMEAEGIDVLLTQNNNDHMGGYVRYFTDMPATNGYAMAVVFPRDDEMTVVMQGPFGSVQELPAGGNGIWRGVGKILTTPSYASADFTKDYDSELAAGALRRYANGAIGLVCTYQMSFALVDYVRRAFSGAKFVDATDLVDQVRVIKSDEEKAAIRKTALMQDGAMRAAFDAVKPGVLDSDVSAAAQMFSQQHGSEQGLYMCGSFPIGRPQKFANRHMQNRRIESGDQFAILVEDSGPGGYYCELGRSAVVGKVPQQMQDEFGISMEARKVILNMLRPGTPCRDIAEAFNSFMRTNNRAEELRLNAHGQGYDLVERPLIRRDEAWTIEKDMNISIHPQHIANGCFSWVCDNYFVGTEAPERVHSFPERIIEV